MSVLYFGPNKIADIMIGTKLKLITNIGVLMDKNRDNTSSKASKIPASTIFFVFDIIKTPFFKTFRVF